MVSPVLFKLLWAAGLFLLAIVLGVADRYYFTNAELLAQRFAEGAERMPWILRLLSPPRFFRSRYAVIGACILLLSTHRMTN
jgi:ABC-type microcin C transport system permease subunit YejE